MKKRGVVDRRTVVEAYLAYDARKKAKPLPDTSGWDWTSADAIDEALRAGGFKSGVLAGYREWQRVELTLGDLRRCAVEARISRQRHPTLRDLGTLADGGWLRGWAPDRATTWFGAIESGSGLREEEPLFLRPATTGEWPAQWYVEDGSGRSTALVANQDRFMAGQVVAYGYLGGEADKSSSFMRDRFPELLRKDADAG